MKLANEKLAQESDSSNQSTTTAQAPNQKIGETISVSKPLVLKKPVIQKASGDTITISKDKTGRHFSYIYGVFLLVECFSTVYFYWSNVFLRCAFVSCLCMVCFYWLNSFLHYVLIG